MPSPLRDAPIPTFRKPVHWIRIASGIDKGLIFTIGDQARGELIGMQIDAMPWQFVVEAESLPSVADLDETGVELRPDR